MSYIALFVASLFEIIWVALLSNLSSTKSVFNYTVLVLCMGLSLYFLGVASKSLPVALTYAVWVSIGIIGQALVQHIYFANPLPMLSWVCLIALSLSIIGLVLSQSEQGA